MSSLLSATVRPNHLQSQHQPMQHGFRREQLSFMAILEHRCTFKAAASVSVLLCAIHAFLQHRSGWTHRVKDNSPAPGA